METALLRVERGRVKGSLTKLKSFADKIPENKTIEDLETRLEREELAKEFKDIDDSLVLQDVESEYDSFEDKYMEIKVSLRQALKKRTAEVQNGEKTREELSTTVDKLVEQQKAFFDGFASSSSSSQIKLPKTDIPPFSGDYKDWTSFKDLFESSIDNRADLLPVHKLQYLKSLLKGEASSIVKHLQITEGNYKEAWDKLIKRYDKKKQIASAYIQTFINQPNVTHSFAANLRRLADTSSQLIRGIDVLGDEASDRHPWLIYLLLSKVDQDTRKAWAEETTETEFPTFDSFIEFLNTRCDALETYDPSSRKRSTQQSIRNLHINTTAKCIICEQSHQIFKCPKFKTMNTSERRKLVGMKSLCFNCLGTGHSAKKCKSRIRCHHCRQAHHSSLHEVPTGPNSSSIAQHIQGPSASNLNPTSSVFHVSANRTDTEPDVSVYTVFKDRRSKLVLLPTAVVHVQDASGRFQLYRILLDSGSQASFASEEFVQRLGLHRTRAKVLVQGLSSTKAGTTKGKITLSLSSRISKNQHVVIDAFILDKLTTPQPSRSFEINDWTFIQEYQLADPKFNQSRRIDLILGADHFFHILREGSINSSPNRPSLHNTIFGYIISGPITLSDKSTNIISLHADLLALDSSLRKFWETEEIPNHTKPVTEEVKLCEEHFESTHYVDPDSKRYVVRLPFKQDAPPLGQSINRAISGFYSLERRFWQDPKLFNEYSTFIKEYGDLHHLESIPPIGRFTDVEHAYLPHHAVIKPENTTTKIRVVFNGSALTSNGVSLNQKLMVGPKIQRDLTPILLTFRSFKIAVVADIEKMYRQILVDKRDRNYQQIIWRSSPVENIQHLWLTTVTYGTSAAPYLATRTLKQLTIDFQSQYPLAERAVLNNFYVDDLLGGAATEEEAVQLFNQLTLLLNQRGFSLRKWNSNSARFLSTASSEISSENAMMFDDRSETLKVLGLRWIPTLDCFTYAVTLPTCDIGTKRTILSESSKLFDPLGLVSPVTITFKILVQQLWLKNFDWDDQCQELSKEFHKLRNDVVCLQELRILRWIPAKSHSMELHGFSDASEVAYAAVIYCRFKDNMGNIGVNIIASKTKVCPIKQLSIPRLELCASTLLAKLFDFVKRTLNIERQHCYAWTDSTVVLAWLSDHPRKWKCFVGNRTSSILSVIPRQQWHHVTSSNNPADIASRGLLSSQLIKSTLWWQGPNWLKDNLKINWKSDNPAQNENAVSEELRERIISNLHTHMDKDILTSVFNRYSSLSRILRILSRCFQFARNCKDPPEKRTSWISTMDQDRAFSSCIQWSQAEAFSKEICLLKQNSPIQSSSRIITLTPFLDSAGTLRVGGRLEYSDQAYDVKHPVILPKTHIFVNYLISHLHNRYLHAGTSLLLSTIRRRFWILSCRSLIKAHINRCTTCVRYRATSTKQLMANLPAHRVGAYRAFANTGIDYAGPIYILTRRGRGARTTKAYIVLFICFSTRAIHLELAGDLTSDTFIASLKRFASRRGIPNHIYTDNGTNFVGANRQLQEIHKLLSSIYKDSKMSNFLLSNRIEWHFNPPSAPHFGGIWDAGVRSVKSILRKVIGSTNLTYEEFNTLLVQIEGLLNSRPLTVISDDVPNLDVLTPAHFLIGQPLTTIPETSTNQCSLSLLGRWRLLQHMHQHFWKRWHVEYLSALQYRPKWQRAEPNLSVGDLVIIKDDNLPPSKWLLGRIITIHPGADGLVRVGTIRTSNGEIRPPTVRLAKLPVNIS